MWKNFQTIFLHKNSRQFLKYFFYLFLKIKKKYVFIFIFKNIFEDKILYNICLWEFSIN